MKEPATLVPSPQRMAPIDGRALRLGAKLRVAVSSNALHGLGEVVVDLLARLHAMDPVLQVGGEGELSLVLEAEPTDTEIIGVRGVDPLGGHTADVGVRERYELVVDEHGATVTACSAEGLFRGATTFLQLIGRDDASEAADTFVAPRVRLADGPALAWRGLSLDVARRFFTVGQVEKVIDLLALYKFNVLHLHLSDSQAWRLEISGWPRLTDPANWPGGELVGTEVAAGEGVRPYYTHDDYQEIVAYAAARYITVVPELDMPGHVLAAVRAYPQLQGDAEPVHELLAFLDPRAEIVVGFVEDVLRQLAELTPGPYLHVGGDEAFGMPGELYAVFVARVLKIARDAGKRVVGWQEVSRCGAVSPADMVQAWIGLGDEFDPDAARAAVPPEYHALLDIVARSFTESAHDVPRAVAAGASVLASASSHLYLDRRYAEDSLLADQTARRTRVGAGSYEPRTSRELFEWGPTTLAEIPAGARLAGIEAAIWGETVTGFDDLAFLLLPRLPGIAEKAWTPSATEWDEYRRRLAGHRHWWDRLGWTGYYRSTEVFRPGTAPR